MNNYADWLLASFGRSFAELFPMQYTRKYHLTTAENMTTDWLGPRIYRPSLEEVLRGALSPSAPHVHYITHFRYPSARRVRVVSEEVPAARKPEAQSQAGIHRSPEAGTELFEWHVTRYDSLVSSVPLPDLIA